MRFMLRSLGTDLVVVALGLSVAPAFAVRTRFDPGVNYWVLSNGAITAEFQVTADGHFRTVQVRDSRTNEEWAAPPNRGSSPIDFQVDDYWFDADTLFDLVEQSTQPLPAGGMRQAIVLRDTLSRGLVTVNLELYDGYPVLRYWVSYKNLTSAPVHFKLGNMLSWTFGDKGKRYTAMRVNQWSLVSKPANFEATA